MTETTPLSPTSRHNPVLQFTISERITRAQPIHDLLPPIGCWEPHRAAPLPRTADMVLNNDFTGQIPQKSAVSKLFNSERVTRAGPLHHLLPRLGLLGPQTAGPPAAAADPARPPPWAPPRPLPLHPLAVPQQSLVRKSTGLVNAMCWN